MNNFVPLGKQSKRQQREFYRQRRKDWGELSPVTRVVKDKNAYRRTKIKEAERRALRQDGSSPFGFMASVRPGYARPARRFVS